MLKEQAFLVKREENLAKQELNVFAAKVQESEDNLLEEAKKTATQAVMRSLVETMLKYRQGEWGLQDIDEAVKIFNEAYPEDVITPDGGEAGAKGSLASAKEANDSGDTKEV